MEKTSEPFQAGDVVRHLPSKEKWLLVCDEEDGRVRPAGWPCTLADAADCEIIKRATQEKRRKILSECANGRSGHASRAKHQLARLGEVSYGQQQQ